MFSATGIIAKKRIHGCDMRQKRNRAARPDSNISVVRLGYLYLREAPLARVYLHVAASAATDSSVSRRYLAHHRDRVERFANAMRREDTSLTEEEAAVEAEVLLGALDGLAFRWLLDEEFEFAKHAKIAAEQR